MVQKAFLFILENLREEKAVHFISGIFGGMSLYSPMFQRPENAVSLVSGPGKTPMNLSPDERFWRARLAGSVSGALAHAAINSLAMIGVQSWKIKRLAETDGVSEQLKTAASEIGLVVESESATLRALSALTASESSDLGAEKESESLEEILAPVFVLARLSLRAHGVAFEPGEIPDARFSCYSPALIRVFFCLLLKSGEALTPLDKKKVSVECSFDGTTIVIVIRGEGLTREISKDESEPVVRFGDSLDPFEKTHIQVVIGEHGGSIQTGPAPHLVQIRLPATRP